MTAKSPPDWGLLYRKVDLVDLAVCANGELFNPPIRGGSPVTKVERQPAYPLPRAAHVEEPA